MPPKSKKSIVPNMYMEYIRSMFAGIPDSVVRDYILNNNKNKMELKEESDAEKIVKNLPRIQLIRLLAIANIFNDLSDLSNLKESSIYKLPLRSTTTEVKERLSGSKTPSLRAAGGGMPAVISTTSKIDMDKIRPDLVEISKDFSKDLTDQIKLLEREKLKKSSTVPSEPLIKLIKRRAPPPQVEDESKTTKRRTGVAQIAGKSITIIINDTPVEQETISEDVSVRELAQKYGRGLGIASFRINSGPWENFSSKFAHSSLLEPNIPTSLVIEFSNKMV
jgi:hypothetical protein